MAFHLQSLPLNAPEPIREIYRSASGSMYTNHHFSRAVCSQIAAMPRRHVIVNELKRCARQDKPAVLLHFAEEKDCVVKGLLSFSVHYPHAQHCYLAKGGHMALLEFPDLVFDAIHSALKQVELAFT